MNKKDLKLQIMELIENGNYYYDMCLDFDIETSMQYKTEYNMNYINNFIKEYNKLKKYDK